ncbi:Trypsin [Gracilaria domingensis]|nr:Trypsin [Gracilaria domingensis]
MKWVNKQSSLHKYIYLLVTFLLLAVIANASETNKTAPDRSYQKITSKICKKVLPVLSRELQSSARRGPDRIVNGDYAPHMKNYMGALVSDTRGFFCSATLLSEYWALTAAHCNVNPNHDILRVGGVNVLQGKDVEIEDTIPHPKYFRGVQGTEENDVQLIKLKSAVPSDTKFFYVNSEPSHPSTSSFARVCGYGDTLGTAAPNSGVLREVDVPVQDSSSCQDQYEDVQVLIKGSAHICAGYNEGGCDSCYGDSGGPLFTVGKDLILVQVGIVSFGLECALPLRPGVYTKLSHYVPWMASTGAVFETTSNGINIFETTPPLNVNDDSGELSDVPSAKPERPVVLIDKPEETQAPSTRSPACFPANAVVELENGNEKKMKELMVGDRVRVGPHEFSEVFMFTHRRNGGHYKFVRIECQNCTTALLLSLDHVLSVNGRVQPANVVRVGDFIIKASEGLSEVKHVSYVREIGLFNPQTIDGRIVVNDIQVTTYTTAIEKHMAHALLTPIRCWFQTSKWLLWQYAEVVLNTASAVMN